MTMRLKFMVFSTIVVCPAAISQNISGRLVGDDTGASIQGATVLAIATTGSHSQLPPMYKAQADINGRFAMAVSSGQYTLCIHDAGMYLNPCNWEGGRMVSATGSSGAEITLRLRRGARFVLRVHDDRKLLPHNEIVSSGISVFVTGVSVRPYLVPLIRNAGDFLDYSALLPMNAPMSVTISSARVLLKDHVGAAVSSQGIPLQISPADFLSPTAGPVHSMFRPPEAKMIHLYTDRIH